MNRSEYNDRLRIEVAALTTTYRNESAAFLVWFLKNIFCHDEQLAIDSVCDGKNDKGIDGIWVDDDSEEIHIFQSKFSPNDGREQGDVDLRDFYGTTVWFETEDTVNSLLSSIANPELKNLLIGLSIREKIGRGYALNLVFITNKIFDVNAKEYLQATLFETYDNNTIFDHYTYIAEEDIVCDPKTLTLANNNVIEYKSITEGKVAVVALPVLQTLELEGIQDRSLFSRNVRFGVGRTRVNREIKKTLLDSGEHSKFFLYHNGITIICSTYEIKNNHITIKDYQVINGCQSLITFYENRLLLSGDIVVLAKIIMVEPHSNLIDKITYYANNQNAISMWDLRSNDRIQIGL